MFHARWSGKRAKCVECVLPTPQSLLRRHTWSQHHYRSPFKMRVEIGSVFWGPMFSFDMVVTMGALFRCDLSQRECVGRMIMCAQRTATRVADVQECTKNGNQECLNWCHADIQGG